MLERSLVALGAGLCAFLAGCDSVPLTALKTFSMTFTGVQASAPPASTSGLQYLRAEWGSGTAFLVLGDRDRIDGREVDVWYSAGRQVLRLDAGRVVGTTGLPVDWARVERSGMPASWRAASVTPARYERVRDEQSPTRFGVKDAVVLKRIAPPADLHLPGVERAQWQGWAWFSEESVPPSEGRGRDRQHVALPASTFAVDLDVPGEPVRYSHQCLSAGFCLRLQPWLPQAAR